MMCSDVLHIDSIELKKAGNTPLLNSCFRPRSLWATSSLGWLQCCQRRNRWRVRTASCLAVLASCKLSRCLSSWIGIASILDIAICVGGRRQGLAVGRCSRPEASASGGRAALPARLLDRRAAPEHGAAAEAAERLLRSQLKVCSKCASPVRPAPCHACCMKQTPRDSPSRIEVSPLFVSSPRPKRPYLTDPYLSI